MTKYSSRKQVTGFTLLEMLVAVGILVIVIAIALPVYHNYTESARNATTLSHIADIKGPLEIYAATEPPLAICQDYLSSVNLPVLDDESVDLLVTFAPIDASDTTKGYRAGLAVSAVVDSSTSMAVARTVHDFYASEGRIAPGETMTDSVVAFEITLTPDTDPFCMAMSNAPSATSNVASGSTATPAIAAASKPAISFSFTTEQQVIEFANDGTGSVINNGPLQTGGDMNELAVEFNVIGGKQVATSGIHGATFLSYGVNGNSDEFYAWKPSDLTVRINRVEYATGIDTTADSETHRYSILWSAATGRLQVLVDGEVKFTKDGVAQGYTIPGGGVLALAQDQDRFQLEDGSQGGNHGFSPADAFHGQIFSASMANRAVDPDDLKDAALANVLDPASGLIIDAQMSGGTVTDTTGNHQLTTHGSVVTRTVPVDASLAVPNASATLRISVTVDTAPDDQLVDLKLTGLLGGTSVQDASGNSGSGSSINLLGWDLSSLTAVLPGRAENMNIGVIATAKGIRGDLATSASYQPLVLDPSRPIP